MLLNNFLKFFPGKISSRSKGCFVSATASLYLKNKANGALYFGAGMFRNFGSNKNPSLNDQDQEIATNINSASAPKKRTSKKSQSSGQSDDTSLDEAQNETGVQEKEREKNFDKMYSLVLVRVIHTCSLYLAESPEQRQNVTEQSRFWYVKQELDRLGQEEEQGFLEYTDRYSVLRHKAEKETTETKKHQNLLNYSKKKVETFLLENKAYAAILARLIIKFLSPENGDFLLYLDPVDDEVSIGKIVSRNKSMQQGTRDLIHNQSLEFKLYFKRSFYNLGLLKLELPKHEGPEISNLIQRALQIADGPFAKDKKNIFAFRVKSKSLFKKFYSESKYRSIMMIIFKRVFRTCKIYLSSSEHEKLSIDQQSRFNYVHNCLKHLSEAEREDFWSYLDDSTKFIVGVGEKMRTPSSVSTMLQFLKHSDFGIILAKLILEFLERENPDFKFYINPIEDEVAIKNYQKRSLSPMGEDTRQILELDLDYLNSAYCEFFQKNLV